MKINRSVLFAIAFLACNAVASANSGDERLTKENIHTKTEAEISARVEVLKGRVEEIRSMDRSTLTKAERKELKVELKEIKKEIGLDDRVTISVGALIIVLLLLIIIL